MAKKESKAVAEAKSTAVGQVQDFGEFSGGGLDDVTSDELVIPFVNVLQALSPEIEEIDGAKAGMLFNKGTQELINGEEGFIFLPVARQCAYVEWIPRAQGGGLVGRHEINSPIIAQAKQECADRGEDPKFSILWTGEPEKSNELKQTYYLFGFVLEDTDEGYQPIGQALLSFNGTKIKVYKNWLTPINLVKGKPPLFAHPTRVTTFKDSNKKGDFYNFKLRPANGTLLESMLRMDNENDLELMKSAHLFSQDVGSDRVKMGDEGDGGAAEGEEIPF